MKSASTTKKLKMARPVGLLLKFRYDFQLISLNICSRFDCARQFSENPKVKGNTNEKEEFRVLQILPKKSEGKTLKSNELNLAKPRTEVMKTDQDWTNVWPAARTFHPAVVPLPIRQGRNKLGPTPDKWANLELMKIPNFLHLTPPAIKKHCEAIKKFCTKWPKELDEKTMEEEFPIEIISSDYIHSSASIKEPLARVISLRFKLNMLNFDKRSKDKFLRLVGERYDPETNYVTITTESCPLKKQNYDYAYYLLTALYFESLKYEQWEKEKSDEDMEEYIFNERQGLKNVKEVFDYNQSELPDLHKFGKALEDWLNEGDSVKNIENYKNASMELLNLPMLKT